MADVVVSIAGREHSLACREGGQDRLRALAQMVDAKCRAARGSVGDTTENRMLVMAALLLADELMDARDNPAAAVEAAKIAAASEADRLAEMAQSSAKRLAVLEHEREAQQARSEAVAARIRALASRVQQVSHRLDAEKPVQPLGESQPNA